MKHTHERDDERKPFDEAELLETSTRIGLIVQLVRGVSVAEAQALVNSIDMQETMLPLLDPTAYRENADGLKASLRVTREFLRFRQVIEEEAAAVQEGRR